ncbi:MAG: hypothetical protein IT370_16390 [Deltaproteobacteria bacterium]|nr:hypothetical protein [Deltaproteobacteria bacterium]
MRARWGIVALGLAVATGAAGCGDDAGDGGADAARPDAALADAAAQDAAPVDAARTPLRPVITLTTLARTFTENGGDFPVDPGLDVSDDGMIYSAMASLTTAAAGDVLHIGTPGSLTVALQGGSTVVLTGAASPGVYAAALRTVSFFTPSDRTAALPRTISFTASDEVGPGVTVERMIDVVAVNDPPINQLPATLSAMVGVPVAISGVAVSDADADGAPLRVTLTASSGTLNVDPPASGSRSGDGTGTVILTGTDTRLTTALATLRYTATSAGAATITMLSDDQGASPAPAQTDSDVISVTVSAGTPPVLGLSGAASSYVEGGNPVPVAPMLTVSSASPITSAVLSIESPRGGDFLAMSAQAPFVATDIVRTGNTTITITHTATAAEYQNQLRFAIFANASDDPGSTRTIRYTVTNAATLSATGTRTVDVTAVNDVPMNVVPGPRAGLSGTALVWSGGNSVGVTDFDAGPMRVTLTPTGGTVSATAAGSAVLTMPGGALQIDGTLVDVNDTLATLRFTPTAATSATLVVASDDLAGGTDSDTLTIGVFDSTSCSAAVHNGHRYFFCSASVDWTGARAACTARSTDLASIADSAEDTIVSALGTGNRWIGLTDALGEACFGWVDSSTPPPMGATSTQVRPGGGCPTAGSFERWAATEPNQLGEEDCVYMTATGEWNDSGCNFGTSYLCESPRD